MRLYLIQRLAEPSTWSALSALLMGATIIPHNIEIAHTATAVGACVTALVGIWMPEKR